MLSVLLLLWLMLCGDVGANGLVVAVLRGGSCCGIGVVCVVNMFVVVVIVVNVGVIVALGVGVDVLCCRVMLLLMAVVVMVVTLS